MIHTLMNHYLTNINAGWSRFDGVDLVIKSQRHPKLNLDGTIMISFHRAKSGVTVLDWGIPFPDFTIPKYPSSVFQVQKALITYQFNYISRALGIWMSLLAQQMPYYRTRRFGYADSLAIAYYHGPSNQTILIPESERGNVAYQRYRLSKNPRAYQAHRYPSKWLINFRISKSLFHGAELSFYVNNLFNNRAYYRDPDNPERYYAGNPEIFYGIEFSMVIDRLFHRRPK
ncbi:MAG: TonB-dependent receptor [candidate division KSB1 bacterium]|nr:TonB-dependent receptor [candidate division KSB1 bacterium]